MPSLTFDRHLTLDVASFHSSATDQRSPARTRGHHDPSLLRLDAHPESPGSISHPPAIRGSGPRRPVSNPPNSTAPPSSSSSSSPSTLLLLSPQPSINQSALLLIGHFLQVRESAPKKKGKSKKEIGYRASSSAHRQPAHQSRTKTVHAKERVGVPPHPRRYSGTHCCDVLLAQKEHACCCCCT